jgi:hypothetical protein
MLQIIVFLMGGYGKIVNIWNCYAVMGHGCNGKLVMVWSKFEFSRVVMLWKCNHVRMSVLSQLVIILMTNEVCTQKHIFSFAINSTLSMLKE